MISELLQTILSWLTTQAQAIFTLDFFLQIGLFLLAILAATALAPWLKGRLAASREQLSGQPLGRILPWLTELLLLLERIIWPLLAALLGSVMAAIMVEAGRESELLSWLTLFLYLGLAYQLAWTVASRRLSEEKAKWLDMRVLRPLVLSLTTLHTLGIFARLLDLGFTISNSRVTLGGLLAGLFVFYLFIIISRESRSLLSDTALPRTGLDPSLTQIVALLTAYFLLFIGLLMALGVAGIPLTTLTIIAGGLSVGVGFGMQELISNFVSGFILLLERSIAPGHVVQVGDTFGTVEHIGIRATSIRDLDNVELIVPNSRFLNEEVVNFTRSDSRVRLRIGVGVSYDADPRVVEKALLSAAEHPLLLSEPSPGVQFVGFGDSSLDFDLLVWTERPLARAGISSALRYNIWYALKEQNIEIPFPQRDIHIRSITMPEKVSQLVS
jgi:potassium-dependent mechanosensitive channel